MSLKSVLRATMDTLQKRSYRETDDNSNDTGQFGVAVVADSPYAASYDSDQITIGAAASDYDVATNEAALFNNVPSAKFVSISSTAAISVKLNTTSDTPIIINTDNSPYTISPFEEGIRVTNLFVSSTPGATVDVFLS